MTGGGLHEWEAVARAAAERRPSVFEATEAEAAELWRTLRERAAEGPTRPELYGTIWQDEPLPPDVADALRPRSWGSMTLPIREMEVRIDGNEGRHILSLGPSGGIPNRAPDRWVTFKEGSWTLWRAVRQRTARHKHRRRHGALRRRHLAQRRQHEARKRGRGGR